MPLFDWECNACGHKFEAMGTSETKPTCPECESADIEKLLTIGSVNMYLGGRNIPRVVEAKPGAYEKVATNGFSFPKKDS